MIIPAYKDMLRWILLSSSLYSLSKCILPICECICCVILLTVLWISSTIALSRLWLLWKIKQKRERQESLTLIEFISINPNEKSDLTSTTEMIDRIDNDCRQGARKTFQWFNYPIISSQSVGMQSETFNKCGADESILLIHLQFCFFHSSPIKLSDVAKMAKEVKAFSYLFPKVFASLLAFINTQRIEKVL